MIDRVALMMDEATVFCHETGYTHSHEAGPPAGLPASQYAGLGAGETGTAAGDMGDAVGADLYDTQGNYVGKLIYAPGIFPKFDYALSNPARTPSLRSFRGGNYQMDAGGGQRFHVFINTSGDITKSTVSTAPEPTAPPAPPAYSTTKEAQEAQIAHESALQTSQEAHDIRMAELNAELAEAEAQADWDRERDLRLEILGLEQDFETEQNEINRQFQAEEAGKVRAFEKKLTLYREAGDWARVFEEITARARDVAASLYGKDPFVGGIRAQGGIVGGQTPYGAFESEVRHRAGAPTPEVSCDMPVSELEAMIGADQGRLPTPGPLIGPNLPGMALGGTVPASAGPVAFKVGEGDLSGGEEPEIIVRRPDGTIEVIPYGGGMAAGGIIPEDYDPNAVFKYDIGTIEQALAPLWKGTGLHEPRAALRKPPTLTRRFGWDLKDVPLEERYDVLRTPMPRRVEGIDPYSGHLAELRKMGYAPRVVSVGEYPDRRFYFIDENQELRPIKEDVLRKYGKFPMHQVLEVTPSAIAGMRTGPALWPGELQRDYGDLLGPGEGMFPARAEIEALPAEFGSFIMPLARTFAYTFRTLDPETQKLILSAAGISHMSPESIEREIAGYSPTGRAEVPEARWG